MLIGYMRSPKRARQKNRRFGRGTPDAGGLLFHMPVDHYAPAVIALMPLCHQILVPGPELLGVGRTDGRAFAPDMRLPDAKDGVSDAPDRHAQVLFMDKAATDVEQIFIAFTMTASADPFQSRIGSKPEQAQEQAFLQRGTIKIFPRSRTLKCITEADA